MTASEIAQIVAGNGLALSCYPASGCQNLTHSYESDAILLFFAILICYSASKSSERNPVPVRYFESGVLFGVAVNSAASIQAVPRRRGQLPAVVSLVFSVVALEAFLNEVTEMASGFLDIPSEPQPFCFSRSAWRTQSALVHL